MPRIKILRIKTLLTLLLAVFAVTVNAEAMVSGLITVDKNSLPPPNATRSVGNSAARIEPPKGWLPKAPSGFTVRLFAEDLDNPRNLLVVGDRVLVAEQFADKVTEITADGERRTCKDDFNRPYGLAAFGRAIYVADTQGVWRLGDGCGGEAEMITAEGALGDGSGHSTRNLMFAPPLSSERGHFFVAIGSRGNIDIEPSPRATIRRFRIDGGDKDGETYAEGLRNPVGMAFHPISGRLWATVVERDRMGDDLVPDYLTAVVSGGFYGWPYYYLGEPQPGFAAASPYAKSQNIIPSVLFRSHSSPLGLTFWGGDAFVALHGSWNSSVPRGFMVAVVRFDADGEPMANGYEPFLTDFVEVGEGGKPLVRGRPTAVAVLNDDELLVADDVGGKIWKVSRGRR